MTRSEVVLVDWPYSDLSGSKLRPAVIVRADFLAGLIDDTLIVKITSRRFGIPGTEVQLDPAIEQSSGLSKICYASCYNILTMDEVRIDAVIGYLSDAAMLQLETCLKRVLELR